MDWKLELVAVPVSDVDRAKKFYVDQVGFVADVDQTVSDEIRFVQLTPPGSACSIVIGTGMGAPAGGERSPVKNLHLVVDDIDAVRSQLVGAGVRISPIEDMGGIKYAYFSDPDGNSWALQEIGPRRT